MRAREGRSSPFPRTHRLQQFRIRSVLGGVLNPRCLARDDADAPLREGGGAKRRGENATRRRAGERDIGNARYVLRVRGRTGHPHSGTRKHLKPRSPRPLRGIPLREGGLSLPVKLGGGVVLSFGGFFKGGGRSLMPAGKCSAPQGWERSGIRLLTSSGPSGHLPQGGRL